MGKIERGEQEIRRLPELKKAGVEREPRKDGSLRWGTFYASTLLDAGETVTALSEYLGHADPGFTLMMYTHLMPSGKQRTCQAVDAVFGDPNGPEQPVAFARHITSAKTGVLPGSSGRSPGRLGCCRPLGTTLWLPCLGLRL